MREPSSPRWVWAQKIETCEVARSSRIGCGISVSGRSANSSRTKTACSEPTFLDLLLEGGRDVARRLVRDDGDPLVRLKPQAIANRVARAGSEFGINSESGGRKTIRHDGERSPWRENSLRGNRASGPGRRPAASGCGTVRTLVGFVHDQVDHVMHVVLAVPRPRVAGRRRSLRAEFSRRARSPAWLPSSSTSVEMNSSSSFSNSRVSTSASRPKSISFPSSP